MNKYTETGLDPIIADAINDMKREMGSSFSLETINLAELQRRTGISRMVLRRLKRQGFKPQAHGLKGRTKSQTILSPYETILNDCLRHGISNSSVCFQKIKELGYSGSLSTVKRYIASHKSLIPAKRALVAPQGNRGRRYTTPPGEALQMDWGFVKVKTVDGEENQLACFAFICHHCGLPFIEFFPNAKQENLFIGMLHGFLYLGVPQFVLTDNMKSVVISRDAFGKPYWQKDYEAFMKTVQFSTKLCKPRHPYTKGKVERLIRYVKDNFLAGQVFYDLSDLNDKALNWCESVGNRYRQDLGSTPYRIHTSQCAMRMDKLAESKDILFYLYPERKITFDGFINYEGRRFGVPWSYKGSSVRINRKGQELFIYSDDLAALLTTHKITSSRKDTYCADQFEELEQPEELPTAPVTTQILQLESPKKKNSFDKFNFDKEEI
jgi:hypothetical protein